MILLVNSNTTYLVMPKAKSRVAGYFQLNNDSKRVTYLKINSAILVECRVLKHVISSVVEAKTARKFYNT